VGVIKVLVENSKLEMRKCEIKDIFSMKKYRNSWLSNARGNADIICNNVTDTAA